MSEEEASFIRSLLKVSRDVTRTSCQDVVSEQSAPTSGWENIRPQAIYQTRANVRKYSKPKVTSSIRVNKTFTLTSGPHVMRGTLDDKWNYTYPGSEGANSARDYRKSEVISSPNKTKPAGSSREKTPKETTNRFSHDQWHQQQVHIQNLHEAISALVQRDALSLRQRPDPFTSFRPQDKASLQQVAAQTLQFPRETSLEALPKQLKDDVTQNSSHTLQRTVSIPNQKTPFNELELLNIHRLPVGKRRNSGKTVTRHKVLDPMVRYELSQLVQSQLHSDLLREQTSIESQLLKVSSVQHLMAPHNDLSSSHSYPNIHHNNSSCSKRLSSNKLPSSHKKTT